MSKSDSIAHKVVIIEKSVSAECFHCGESCDETSIVFDQKKFCCEGCRTVYEILNSNGLCTYYSIEQNPGTTKEIKPDSFFGFLDEPEVRKKLLLFSDNNISIVKFHIPSIHCNSCIWLLENLYKIDSSVRRSSVNFLRREATISFVETKLSLKDLVKLLYSIGYPPRIGMDSLEDKVKHNDLKSYYSRLGVAFFCFGNIMLFSFPEYLGLNILAESEYRMFFGYLNFILSLPVVLFSASVFFKSAWTGVKMKSLNIDFPIALGILAMFVQSTYDIFAEQGAGFMDTLASLIFLMLAGRLFQDKTYYNLSFDRDYRSYFPVAVTVMEGDLERSIPISDLKQGNRLLIRNNELIPADCFLFKGEAFIDYSFVTGESALVTKNVGELIYAGGRHKGAAIEVETIKEVSQSYLTELWNDEVFSKEQKMNLSILANRVSKWFAAIVLLIAFVSFVFWSFTDMEKGLRSFTSVLIITCPCALALSSPFVLGTAVRYLSKNNIYLKSSSVVEKLAEIDAIVFDKTGTITTSGSSGVVFTGLNLNDIEKIQIRSLASHSSHPLNKWILEYLGRGDKTSIVNYKEIAGKGIEAVVDGVMILLGSADFTGAETPLENTGDTKVYVNINGRVRGAFVFRNIYRQGFDQLVKRLSPNYTLSVLSGDNNGEESVLKKIMGKNIRLNFNCSPHDKLQYIKKLQAMNEKVLMIGDGLNDSGALQQSNVGMVVADDVNNFVPACDLIIQSSALGQTDRLLAFSKGCIKVMISSFILSFCYNMVGIAYAVSGNLSPLIAAILMPLSSVTVVVFAVIGVGLLARKNKLS